MLTNEHRISLDGAWRVRIDPEGLGFAQGWAAGLPEDALSLDIPGCVQSLDGLAGDYPPAKEMHNSYAGTYFLERGIDVPAYVSGRHCRVVLGAVLPCAYLWVNGHFVGKCALPACQTAFDATNRIVPGARNRLTLAVTEENAGLCVGMRFQERRWSGPYGSAWLEIGGQIALDALCLQRVTQTTAVATGIATNLGETDWHGVVEAELAGREARAEYALRAGERAAFELTLNVEGLSRWSPDQPALHTLRVTADGASQAVSVGLRRLTAEGASICLDGEPVYFAGAGSEYYSTMIHPLTDRALIRRRFQALKDFGFCFYRCHTHLPTEEELSVADEMGVMLDAEFGLVSNFNKMTPPERALELIHAYVLETRRHPSLVIYGLGNEGSQLMVESETERANARLGYARIKGLTDAQFAIIAFGIQGELMDMPNDLESPHLWSEDFRWGYDGLSDIPWGALANIMGQKPALVHEYGKFGVWPDIREEELYPKGGALPDFGRQARLALEERGRLSDEALFMRNSRLLSACCTRIILEEARRQSSMAGYALWMFFRRGDGNAGLCSDTGAYYDVDPTCFRLGCNADVALLIDRGFRRRALVCGQEERIGFTVSNYGRAELRGARVRWRVREEARTLAEGESDAIFMARGQTGVAGEARFTLPGGAPDAKLSLDAELLLDARQIARGAWDFWRFNDSPDWETPVLVYAKDSGLRRALRRTFVRSMDLTSADSVRIGCRAWTQPRLSETACAYREAVLVADCMDETVRAAYEAGVRVLVLDGGDLPEDWMAPPVMADLGARDTGRFFTSFRAGWSQGNLLTVVHDDSILADFPQEGWCDLQFYDMVQDARAFLPDALRGAFGEGAADVIECVAKLSPAAAKGAVVQDPNARKEVRLQGPRTFRMMEKSYLTQVRDGSRRMALCTLNLADNPAGRALLKRMARALHIK